MDPEDRQSAKPRLTRVLFVIATLAFISPNLHAADDHSRIPLTERTILADVYLREAKVSHEPIVHLWDATRRPELAFGFRKKAQQQTCQMRFCGRNARDRAALD